MKTKAEILDDVARALEGIKTRTSGGRVGFGNLAVFEDYWTVVECCLPWNKSLPAAERRTMALGTIYAAGEEGKIDGKSLHRHSHRLQGEFLRTPESDFVVASSLSFSHSPELRRIRLREAMLTFSSRHPKAFTREVDRRLINHRDKVPPEDYVRVRARVRARSEHEAVDKVFDAVDLLRGIWNLKLNGRLWARVISSGVAPVNTIRWGPILTVHRPNGMLATETFWSQECVRDRRRDLGSRWGSIRQHEREMRRSLSRLPYRADVESALRRYARALDTGDHESSFLKLWGILELLTASGAKNYDVTVRRALFLYPNNQRPFWDLVLTHLRERRNAVVHSGESSDRSKMFAIQLKRYVEDLIAFHLESNGFFGSLNEAAEFLDRTVDEKELERQVALHEAALRFRRGQRWNRPRTHSRRA